MLLLDTCTLLWLAGDQKGLSATARALIADNADGLFVSAISAFEIAVKHRGGRLELPIEPSEWFPAALKHHGINEVPVDSCVAIRATELPPLHRDPCDRIIIATAQIESLRILTPDQRISAYPDADVRW